MARAKRERTSRPGVFRRQLAPRVTVYDVCWRVPGRTQPVWATAVKRPDGSYATLQEAADYRDEQRVAARRGQVAAAATPRRSDTLEGFAGEWLQRVDGRAAMGKLRDNSTAAKYHWAWDKHIAPRFSAYKLAAMGRPDLLEELEAWRTELLARPLAPDTVRTVLAVLQAILGDALARGRILYNPAAHVEKPPARRREPEVLPSLGEWRYLASCAPACYPDAERMVLLSLYLGVRPSELFGLRLVDCDLTAGAEAVRIGRAVYKGQAVDRTKTAAGKRFTPAAARAGAVLREQSMALQMPGLPRPNPQGLVFPGLRGGAWRDSNWNRRVWQPMLADSGLRERYPAIIPYWLRYAYNSLVRASGLAPAITMQLLGHEDERTHDGYTRPISGMEPVIRAALDQVFGEPS